jgi:orotidine-5'-phosphate decarboxylase
MNYNEIVGHIKAKKSFLCVGLDSDLEKIPEFLKSSPDPIFEFNKAIVDATHKQTVAYKPNMAFYECYGLAGWKSLEKTVDYIRSNYPGMFLIADAKRGDIGNTSKMYAKTFFEVFDFDAVTVNPYMGIDSVTPFLEYKNRWVILLALTSNKGADNFQKQTLSNSKPLYIKVLEESLEWGTKENLMYVVGATQSEMLSDVRKVVPNNFLLVPGVGAQGGELGQVARFGMNSNCGLLVNSSRQILYASNNSDFADAANREAVKVQSEMQHLLEQEGL